MNPSSTLEKM
jgi:threonine dehydrogenase-like Zn-dependent dehydrogenase